jgi:hypothetical protein
MMSDRFDLEQQILTCWHVTDDLEIILDYIANEDKLDRDKLLNMLLGIKELYHLKFTKCFDTFEEIVTNQKFS